MAEFTITLPFACRMSDDRTGFSYACDVDGVAGYFGSVGKAKKVLREQIGETVRDALASHANMSREYLGCSDGTVLIVGYRYHSWGYEIVGPNRQHASGCCGSGDFEEWRTRAREHAEQSYGGVVWSHR